MARTVRCLICNNPALVLYVNGLLDKGLSNAGIAAGVVEMGGKLDPDVVSRHKSGHWTKPVPTDGPKPTRRDLDIMVRDKVADAIEDLAPEALLFMGKDMAPMVNAGLKAQAGLKREAVQTQKLGLAAGALTLQAFIAGMGRGGPPPELDDGNTIDGDAVEL